MCCVADGSPDVLKLILDRTKPKDIEQRINHQIRGNTLKWRNIYRFARFLVRCNLSKSTIIDYFAHEEGVTALHYAAHAGDVDKVNLLLEYGANPSIKNAMGTIPVDHCFFPEIRGGLKRIQHKRELSSGRQSRQYQINLQRRESTASDLKFPMYLVSLHQLQRLYVDFHTHTPLFVRLKLRSTHTHTHTHTDTEARTQESIVLKYIKN